MRIYNTLEVARLLGTCQETVRRWAVSGQLKATCLNRRMGWKIDERDLYEFVSTHPEFRERVSFPHLEKEREYADMLKEVLRDLTIERDQLNKLISKIREIL